MAGSNNQRWLIIGILVTFGLALAAFWPRHGAEEDDAGNGADSGTSAPADSETSQAVLPAAEPDAGAKGRRIFPDCEPVEESLKYDDFVGKRALVILSWHDMPERAANLEIPVQVVGIEDGTIGVRFMQFPMREQYIGIWLGSEHIRAGEQDVFLLDPCSATIIEWTAMERGAENDDQ